MGRNIAYLADGSKLNFDEGRTSSLIIKVFFLFFWYFCERENLYRLCSFFSECSDKKPEIIKDVNAGQRNEGGM